MDKDLTEKQKKTYDLLRDFASNNSLPFSIKAHQIGEQVGYKVTPGEKEGYEACCSGAESCMQALKERNLLDYDTRRHTGFIVKNITSDTKYPFIYREGDDQYNLDEVTKFNKELLSSENQSVDKWLPEDFAKDTATAVLGKTVGELKEEKLAEEGSVKIKINGTEEVSQEFQLSSGFEIIKASENNSSRLAVLEDWRREVKSELFVLASRIDVLENENVAVEKAEVEASKKELDELSMSRLFVLEMMYLSRFFRVGVRKDDKLAATKPDLIEFSKISASINNGVALRVDSFKHKDIHSAEMSGAIVVLQTSTYSKYFISMNQEEKELFSQCSEMFSEFDINDFTFNSESYCETSHWNIKREQKLTASPSECSECHRSFDELKGQFGIPIQIHHISAESYSRIFRENLDDLVVLCKECHEKKHLKEASE